MTSATKADAQPTVEPSEKPVDAPVSTRKKAPAPRKTVAKKPPQAAVKAPVKKTGASRNPLAVKTPSPAKNVVDEKAQPSKKPKHKLVRDSFTMPGNDFQLIDQLKQRALGFKRPAKKSELLRAGLHALVSLSDAKLKAALDALDPLKPGRPRKTPA